VGIELMIEGFWERVMLFGFAIMLIFALHSMLSDGVIESGPHRFTREDHPGMFWTLVRQNLYAKSNPNFIDLLF